MVSKMPFSSPVGEQPEGAMPDMQIVIRLAPTGQIALNTNITNRLMIVGLLETAKDAVLKTDLEKAVAEGAAKAPQGSAPPKLIVPTPMVDPRKLRR